MNEETPAQPDFETALAELESLVERMEQGNLSLEETLEQFERGIRLTRSCQTALKAAEQRVEVLLRQAGEETVAPLEPQDRSR
ncbi:exodeoxyribonuclease VII small subunit [soil metagenome]